MNSLKPSLGQLPAPSIDGVQGITRPLAFNSPNGNSPNGNAPNGNSPNGNAPNGNSPNGNSPNGNSPNGNAPGGNGKKARVTMVRAEWCGFCKKAMPEWEKLKGEIHDKVVNGYHMVLRDLEQKRDEGEIKKNYSDINGYPTYVVEVQGPDGEYKKSGTFNSIEMNDMNEKIKKQLQ
jgi:thiol-disulfide isomerase/thioredoxin